MPAPLLPQLRRERLDWLVPGLIEAKAVALVRGLPKAIRKNFVPVPDFVGAALAKITFGEGALSEALGRELTRMTGARVPDEAWAEAAAGLENHLKMNIEVVDARGKFLGEGRDRLNSRHASPRPARRPGAAPAEGRAEAGRGQGFCPCRRKGSGKDGRLVDDGLSGAGGRGWVVRKGASRPRPRPSGSTVAPCSACCCSSWRSRPNLRNRLPGLTELGLLYRDMGKVDALVEDILLASTDSCILDGEAALPRDGAALASLAERKRGDWTAHAERLARLTLEILKHWHGLQKRFKGKIDLARAVALNDIKAQLAHLVYPGFVRETPAEWLKEYPVTSRLSSSASTRLARSCSETGSGPANWAATGSNTGRG